MKNPLMVLPTAFPAMMAFAKELKNDSVPARLLSLIHLRASQINACSVCVLMHAKELEKLDETRDRLTALAAWRETTLYSPAERAVLALTEETTRIADKSDPVSDATWAEVAKHFDETQCATIVLNIAMINFFNRLNAATRQVAGAH